MTSQNSSNPFATYPEENFSESAAADITAWKLARAAIEHENNLINHRLTWFFTSQALLLTAFFAVLTLPAKSSSFADLGTVHTVPVLFFVIGFLAIYMCLVTNNGLGRALIALDRIDAHYEELRKRHGFARTPPLQHRDVVRVFDSRYIPLVTAGMWVVLEVIFAALRFDAVRARVDKLDASHVMFGIGIVLAGIALIAIVYSVWVNKVRKRQGRGT